MKTIDGTHDTIINVINYRDDICVLGAECKIHNHKMIQKTIILKPRKPEKIDVDVDGKMVHLYVNEFDDTMTIEPEKQHVKFEQSIVRYDSDTIQPCDLKFIQKGDTRLTSEFIKWPEQKTYIKNENLDGLCFGLTLGFMTHITLKYFFGSFHDWVEFINELKIELKS
jgi:hypothetical protein